MGQIKSKGDQAHTGHPLATRLLQVVLTQGSCTHQLGTNEYEHSLAR